MKVTVAAPLLYALEVPTLVAVPIVGAAGTVFPDPEITEIIDIR